MLTSEERETISKNSALSSFVNINITWQYVVDVVVVRTVRGRRSCYDVVRVGGVVNVRVGGGGGGDAVHLHSRGVERHDRLP